MTLATVSTNLALRWTEPSPTRVFRRPLCLRDEPLSSLVVQGLVEPRRLAGLVVALGEAWSVAGRRGVEAGSEGRSPLRSWRWAATAARRGTFSSTPGQCRQPGGCAVRFADGDGTVEADDRRVGESEQLVVPLHDLYPVGVLEAGSVRVERGDGRLCLVLAELVLREGGLKDGDSVPDELGLPLPPVLLGERHDPAIGAGATAAAGVVQQHQGEQTVEFGVVDQGRQLPRAGWPRPRGRRRPSSPR